MTDTTRRLGARLAGGVAAALLAMALGTGTAIAEEASADAAAATEQQASVAAVSEDGDGYAVVSEATDAAATTGDESDAISEVADDSATTGDDEPLEIDNTAEGDIPTNPDTLSADTGSEDLQDDAPSDGVDACGSEDGGAAEASDAPLPGDAVEAQAGLILVTEELRGAAGPGEQAPALAPGELDKSSYDAALLLEDGGVYSFSPSGTTLLVSNVSDDAKLASYDNYLSGYWRVKNLGSGLYAFESLDDGKPLSFSEGTRLANVSLNGSVSTWMLVKCEDGSISLVPKGYDGLRLDIYSGKLVAGGNLQLYTANGTAAQRFVFVKQASLSEAAATGKTVAPGVVSIVCADATGKSLDVKSGSVANCANVQVYKSNDSLAQRYQLDYKGNGLYTIKVVKSGKYLDVAYGSSSAGANVWQYQSNSTLAQYWYLKKVGSTYVICNAKSGLALDRYLSSSANGTNVQVWRQNGSKAQTFKIAADKPLGEAVAVGKVYDDGIYTIKSALGTNMVLDVVSGRTNDGANVQIYTSNNSLPQKWELTYLGNGLYTIQAAHSGKYLNAAGTTKGSNVDQKTNDLSRNEMWYFVKSGSGYAIKNSLSGLVIDLANGKSTKGTNVQAWTANGSNAQRFGLSKVALLADGTYVFSSRASSAQLIEVKDASSGNGANVQVSRMRKSTGQQWTITYLGNGAYRIANKNSGLVLDVANGSTANGANVRQYRSNGTDAQKWEFGIADDGSLVIRNVKSGLYLDLAGGKSANGTNVQQYRGNGSAAQSFVAYTVGSSFVTSGKTGYQNPGQFYQISAYNCTLPSYASGFYTYVTSSRISPTATREQCIEAFIQCAYEYLGTAYVWDWAMAPGQGVDCAGLVMQCLYAVGMQTPYNTYDHMYDPWQDHNAENMRADTKFKQVSFSERQRGDLIFYPGHVAIYLGNDQIINASPPDVHIQSVYSWTVTGVSRVFV